MSVSELLQLYQMYERNGIRNINCGYLRSIGKTECLKELIRNQNPIAIMPIVLVPRRDMSREYDNLCRTISIPDLDELRGFTLPCHIYADEVPNAEEIVNDLHRTNMRFIAGFYSIPVSRPVRVPLSFPINSQTRTLNATWSIDEETRSRVIQEWEGQSPAMRQYRTPRDVEPMTTPSGLRLEDIVIPVQKPVKHIKTKIKVVNKNIKMKFIGK